ncbi:diguanylate cyclase domain-containing protein [Halarcobacter bivalviorum]|uniref:GGDEF domain-containing protein n=1 Tax=Halarcobacter bivalviorum TaxID=663364 RepID=A0AAX2A9J9_9BACT|nr:diguanylate cyclase [Halarcobacter bivalviorum]AXH11797.1 hypothetical protein ABIV_0784 [Halarcobacter bivalviorum]RXK10924.1 hypothetical protein CRV05_00700 [Halarcobacter bivalviorum]
MKDRLKEITDLTINELLEEEVILPSEYFECFDKHAKLCEVDLEDEEFEKEVDELLLKEIGTINDYVKSATKSIDSAATLTLDAQKAIEENNSDALKKLYSQIRDLQIELQDITENIYKDYLTSAYNKKWLYHKYLAENSKIKEDAIIILIDVTDFEYIKKTYNKLISNNLLIFIFEFINKEFKKEDIDFEICRYLTNKFIISVKNNNFNSVTNLIKNTSSVLFGTTLKSNSGVMIKPNYKYSTLSIKKDDSFHEILNSLIKKLEA